jgi:hypothetical protein
MSVRITVTVIVEDGITVEDLKQWVVDEDAAMAGRENAIALENVKPSNVLQELFEGSIEFEVVDESMEEL